MKTFLTIITLFFFISSGILSLSYIPVVCDADSCCKPDCCEERCDDISDDISGDVYYSSVKNCCNFEKGIPGKFENTVMCIFHSNYQPVIILNHTDNTFITQTNIFHSAVYSTKPPLIHNFFSALRI